MLVILLEKSVEFPCRIEKKTKKKKLNLKFFMHLNNSNAKFMTRHKSEIL